MANSDRLLYQASYSSVINEEAKPNNNAIVKRQLRMGRLTILQKNAILKMILDDDNLRTRLYSVARGETKIKDSKLERCAHDIVKIVDEAQKPLKAHSKILAKIGKLSDKLVELPIAFINLPEPEQPKSKQVQYAARLPPMAQVPQVDPATAWMFSQSLFGFLHLERLRFTPEGTKVGEHIYSLPLAPGEEVVLSHKTWSKTAKEFTELVQNEIEKEITTQRTESLDISESTKTQSQYSADMSTTAQGGGDIGVVKVSGSSSIDLRASLDKTKEESIKRSVQNTEKATARSKQEHKITFQVSSEVGYEDEAHRRIKNPNSTNAVRYDYFRFMLKWKISLERYGVRLTMDTMVSDPGSTLREYYDERKRAEEMVGQTFECTKTPADIDDNNLPPGVSPRPQPYSMVQSGGANPMISTSEDQTKTFTVPDGYEVDHVEVAKTGGGGHCEVKPSPDYYRGMRGDVTVTVHVGVGAGEDKCDYELTMYITPTAETISAWESSAVQALCLEDKAKFDAAQAAAQATLEKTTTKEMETPALYLRKEEREEIMAKVISQFLPPTITLESAPDSVVRFIHEAFEWENMSYFLYPYFWKDIPSALEIEHYDVLRKDFLKSSWARVLVPIRPGYEESVLAFSYNGDPDESSYSDKMRTVAQQIMDANNTTYAYEETPEGVRTEKFEVIATWYEYTPTDSLDIKANLIQDDVAEPSLEDRLENRKKLLVAEIEELKVENETMKKVKEILENLPATTKIAKLKSGNTELEFTE